MKKLIPLLLLWALPAFAQQPVFTLPTARITTNSSGTVAVTNTFQEIWPIRTGRIDCSVQNNSTTNVMYVFIGPIASATLAKSVKLAAGQALTCSIGGTVPTDAVNITGTSGDAFYAATW
jgi:hypothetical protein